MVPLFKEIIMEMQISERIQTVQVLANTALVAATPQETARVELKDSHKLRFVLRLEANAGANASIVIKEHDAASGGNSQDLTLSVPSYAKLDAAAGVEVDASVSPLVDSVIGVNAGFYFIEIDPLDLTDGFKYVSVEVTSAAARDVYCLAELSTKHKPAYQLEI